MIWGIPIQLLIAYALYRAIEYFMIKWHQAMNADQPSLEIGQWRLARSVFLLLARIAGWVVFALVLYVHDWAFLIKMALIAFPLSLVLQMVLLPFAAFLGPLGFILLPATMVVVVRTLLS